MRSRKVDGKVLFWIWAVPRLRNFLSPCFQIKSKGRKEPTASFKAAGRRNSLLLTGQSAVVLLRPSTEWMGPTHYQSASWNANVIQKHSQRHTQNSVWPNVWAPCGQVTLTHKINHHTNHKGKSLINSATIELGTSVHPKIPKTIYKASHKLGKDNCNTSDCLSHHGLLQQKTTDWVASVANIYFSQFWRPRNPRWRCWHAQCLVRTLLGKPCLLVVQHKGRTLDSSKDASPPWEWQSWPHLNPIISPKLYLLIPSH